MLRITVVDLSESAVVLRVEGRITALWVEELRRTCAAHAFAAHAFVGHTFPDEVQLSLSCPTFHSPMLLGLHSSRNYGVGVRILSAPPHSYPKGSKMRHPSIPSKATKGVHADAETGKVFLGRDRNDHIPSPEER